MDIPSVLEAIKAAPTEHVGLFVTTGWSGDLPVVGQRLGASAIGVLDLKDLAADPSLLGRWVTGIANGERGTRVGSATVPSLSDYAAAVHYNGLGNYEAAFTAARKACDQQDHGLFLWALIELVEAATRSHRHETASVALGRISEFTAAGDSEWALGIEARSRALLAQGQVAETFFRAAVEHLGRTRIAVHHGRAHLVYGEWLRRSNRRVDARVQLRRAHDILSEVGATAFAERARGELLATCETVRKRSVDTFGQLTAEETQIARLARDGYTNPEIGARLFISPRTVEWHLRKVFTKLNITSRRELREALPPVDRPAFALA